MLQHKIQLLLLVIIMISKVKAAMVDGRYNTTAPLLTSRYGIKTEKLTIENLL
jgi:hypothetical protein